MPAALLEGEGNSHHNSKREEILEMDNAKLIRGIRTIRVFDDRLYPIELMDGTEIDLPSVTTKLNGIPKPVGLMHWFKDTDPEEIEARTSAGLDKGSRVHFAAFVMAAGGLVLWDPPREHGGSGKMAHEHDLLIQQAKIYGKPWIKIHEEDEMVQVTRLRRWFKEMGITPDRVAYREAVVWSLEHKTAGTLDLAVWLEAGEYKVSGADPLKIEETGWYIIDYKTGRLDIVSARIQVGIYAILADKCLPLIAGKIKGGIVVNTDASTVKGIAGLKCVFVHATEFPALLVDFKAAERMWELRNPNIRRKLGEFETECYLTGTGWESAKTGFIPVEQAEVKAVIQPLHMEPSGELFSDTPRESLAETLLRPIGTPEPSPTAHERAQAIEVEIQKIAPDYPRGELAKQKFANDLIRSVFGADIDPLWHDRSLIEAGHFQNLFAALQRKVEAVEKSKKRTKTKPAPDATPAPEQAPPLTTEEGDKP